MQGAAAAIIFGAGDAHGSIVTEHPLIYSGDFASPEQIILPGGICGKASDTGGTAVFLL